MGPLGGRAILTGTIAGGVLLVPLLVVWLLVGRAPTVTVRQAQALLHGAESRTTSLVVVRGPAPASIPSVQIWPQEEILAARGASDVPEALRGHRLLLLCPSGLDSAQAARHLNRIGVGSAYHVWGGAQAWRAESGDAGMALRVSPPHEQVAAVAAFFGVKMIYSLLAVVLVALLWRERAADLVTLRWSLVAFFVGEAFCFVNVMALGDRNVIFEHAHTLGMVAALALAAHALLEGLDRRVLHFSDEGRCALTGVCGACAKSGGPPCALRRTLLLALPGMMVLAALPLFAPVQYAAYSTRIFGAVHGYGHAVLHQLFELRFLPGLTLVLLLAAGAVVLWFERRTGPISRVLVSAAFGAIAFSYFRLILVAVFSEVQVWFAVWEEVSELVFVGLVGVVVLSFRLSSAATRIGADLSRVARPA